MERFKNPEILLEIGKRIEDQRIEKEPEIEDVVEMAGFSANTIRQVEAGNETSLSYFVEICKAVEIHPMEILDFPISMQGKIQIISMIPALPGI